MSSDAIKSILDEQAELENDRRIEEHAWREMARLFRPQEQDFDTTTDNRVDDTGAEIFDSTPLYALDDFTGGLYGQGVNPTDRWFGFGVADDPDLAEWGPVKRFRFQASNLVFATAAPAVSGFYARAPAWIANLGLFGLGPSYSEEVVGQQQFIDLAIPVGEIYLKRDLFGNYIVVNRKFVATGAQAKRLFGKSLSDPVDDKQKYAIVHSVRENPQFQRGAIGPRGKAWTSCYVSPDLKTLYVEGGYYELPYHIPTWQERMRSAYGMGIGHTARFDAAGLQEMERSDMVGAQFRNEPPLLLHDESTLTAADIAPFATMYGTMTEQGKRMAEWLEMRGSPVQLEKKIEQKRASIRMAFRFSMMQVANRPQMTLGEFSGWKEQELKLMAPNLVRMQTGGLANWVMRRYRMLARARQMPPLPRELEGRPMSIEFESPLARVQKMATARGVLQAHEALEKFAVTDPSVRDRFDGDAAVKHVVGAFTEVPDLLRSDEAVEKMRTARAQAQGQQIQLEQNAQRVETAAVASHAMQAKTLADNRSAA